MNPNPENVEGRLVESHEFVHSVEHQVNWSHVLAAVVLLVAVWKVGVPIAAAAGSTDRDRRQER